MFKRTPCITIMKINNLTIIESLKVPVSMGIERRPKKRQFLT